MPVWPAKTVEAYIAALQDVDRRVRRQAAAALEILGDQRAVAPLIHSLVHDENPDVRANAARALGKLGHADTVAPLITALADPYPQVRDEAVRALHKLGDPRAVEPLGAALQDSDGGVRYDAARALGALGDARAVYPLLAALAVWGDDAAMEVALCQLGKAALPDLIDALTDANSNIRKYAARALRCTDIKDRRAIAPLTAALQDEHADVRHEVAESLRALTTPLDEETVESHLRLLMQGSPPLRVYATKVLAWAQDPRAVAALRAALEDEDRDVRAAAAEVLHVLSDTRER